MDMMLERCTHDHTLLEFIYSRLETLVCFGVLLLPCRDIVSRLLIYLGAELLAVRRYEAGRLYRCFKRLNFVMLTSVFSVQAVGYRHIFSCLCLLQWHWKLMIRKTNELWSFFEDQFLYKPNAFTAPVVLQAKAVKSRAFLGRAASDLRRYFEDNYRLENDARVLKPHVRIFFEKPCYGR